MTLEFIPIDDNNLHIFRNLAQSYEGEFSKLTQKLPDDQGLFNIDTLPKYP